MVDPTRRSFLTTAAAVIASPAAAVPCPDDRQLLNLCAEVVRLREQADVIEVTRVWPHDDEVERILCADNGTRRQRIDAAEAYSIRCGDRAAGNEVGALLARADVMLEEMLAIPATSPAGRAAKVETLLRHLDEPGWREPDEEAGWEFRAVRSLLRELV